MFCDLPHCKYFWLSNVLFNNSDLAVTEAVEYHYKASSRVPALVFQLHGERNLCSCFDSWAKKVFIYSFILFITKCSCRCDILLLFLTSKVALTFKENHNLYTLYLFYFIHICYNVICTLINIFKYFESLNFYFENAPVENNKILLLVENAFFR